LTISFCKRRSLQEIDGQENYMRRLRLPEGARPVIYIDTWQRATASGGQNEDKDMQEAIRNAEFIGKELGGPVVVASHPPKGNAGTINGSGVIQNSSVAIWDMRPIGKSGTSSTVTVTRIKGAGNGTKIELRRVTQEINGTDNYGCQRKGAVLMKDGRPISPGQRPMVEASLTPDGSALLLEVTENPCLSSVKHADRLGWIGDEGRANESRVKRAMEQLRGIGLVRKSDKGSYIATSTGAALAHTLRESSKREPAEAPRTAQR
jgi:hypothetical protein